MRRRRHGAPRHGILATALLLATAATSLASERAVPPSFVVLITDDQRHDTFGFLHPVLTTPAMDRLADEGVWFQNAFAATPVCWSSRATMLTGLHERAHGIGPTTSLPLAVLERSAPRLLRAAGYTTGLVGKNGVGLDLERQQLLFDWFLQVDRAPYIQEREGELIHATDYTGRKAVQFLAARAADEPFLLVVSFNAPHADDGYPAQFIPPTRYADLYQGVNHPDPPLSDPEFFLSSPVFLQESLNRIRWHWRWTPPLADTMMSRYLAMIHGVDDAVGSILAELERSGRDADTVIVLIGDNGYFVGDRGLAGKWLPYEASIRVPLIVFDPRAPASQRGRTVSESVSNVDLPETLLDMAGVPIPREMQGTSLVPLLEGVTTGWRTTVFLEHAFTQPPDAPIPRHESLRTGRFKYIHYLEHDREELYDLLADPDEAHDLAADPAMAVTLGELRQRTLELGDLYSGLIFDDDFESGDLGAWSAVPP